MTHDGQKIQPYKIETPEENIDPKLKLRISSMRMKQTLRAYIQKVLDANIKQYEENLAIQRPNQVSEVFTTPKH